MLPAIVQSACRALEPGGCGKHGIPPTAGGGWAFPFVHTLANGVNGCSVHRPFAYSNRVLNIVIGPYARLERELAERLRELRKPGGPALLTPVAVLAPSRRLLSHLQTAIAKEHQLALANVFFETFQSFARRLLSEEGIPAIRFAESPAVEERVVERALDRLGEDHPLRALAGTPGLLGSLLSTIRDLDEARVTAEALGDPHLEAVRGAGGLTVIQPLLEALEREREGLGLLNRAAVISAATEMAAESKWLGAHAAVFHYGAYDLSQHQLDWIGAIGKAVETTVLFPGTSDREGRLHKRYRFAEPTLSVLRTMAADERWLDGGTRIRPDPGLIEAGDPAEEFELIAEQIRGLVDEQRLKPSGIVVTARSLDGVMHHATAAFARAGIPWETPQPTPIDRLPAGKGLIALAAALAQDATPASVAELAAQDWLAAFPKEAGSLTRVTALARRLPPIATARDWEAIAVASDPDRDPDDIAAARAVAAGLSAIERHTTGFPANDSWTGFVDRWVAAIEALAPAPSRSHAQVLEAGLTAVEELRRLDAVEPAVAKDRFHARARRALDRAGVLLKERIGGVRLLSAMDARGVRPEAMFIAQANDGLFPRASYEDPFLKDDARRALLDPLGYKIQTKRADASAEEALLFNLIASSPKSSLFICWHAEDGRGRPAAVSPLAMPLVGGESGVLRARQTAAGLREKSRVASLGSLHPDRTRDSIRVMRELEGAPTDGPTDRDGPPAAATSRPLKLRVTSFRDLATCPLKVWFRAALKIEPPRGPRAWWEPEAWRIGNVLHHALDEALPLLLNGRYASPTDAANLEIPKALAAKLPTISRLPVLKAAIETELADLVAQALDAEQTYLEERKLAPDRYEERFEKAWGKNGLTLSAQADRLDRGPNGTAHVTDYKSHGGRSGYGKTAKLEPGVLQVSLYLELLAPEASPMFSVVHLGNAMRPKVQPNRADGEKALEITGQARTLSEALERLWLKGRASPWPDGLLLRKSDWEPECKYCDFRTTCRGDHAPTRARLQHSRDLQAVRDAFPQKQEEPS